MLRIYNIFVYYVLAWAIIMFGAQSALASNDEVVSAPVDVTDSAESNDNTSETGVSGSYLSSQFSRSTGDINSATKSLRSVYDKNQQNTDVATQLMGLYLLDGKVDNAMEIASKIAKTNVKEPISTLMLSLQAIKNNDAVTASRILDEVFADEGGQLWLPLISAWLDVEQHKLLKPLMMEELSAEVGKAAPIVNYHLALINARAGFTQNAIDNFKKSIEDSTRPPVRVMQALLQFYKQNNSPEALQPLVNAYLVANQDALKDNLLVIDNMRDGAAEVLLTMGSIMLAADVTQDATLYLQLALYLNPNLEIATLALSQAYTELQQYGIANELLAKVQSSSKLYNNAQLYMAVNLGRLKKIDEAIAKLDALILTSPDNIDAYVAKGDLLRTQENFADAVTVYKAALGTLKEEKEQHWSIFFALGACFDRQGNWEEAEKHLMRSLELSPNQPDVLNYLGYSLLLRGDNLQQARKLIEKAIAKRPMDPQIMDSEGWVLYMAGDYNNSVGYLERAVSLLPADATVNDHLGDVYWRLGRKNEARFQWNRSLIYVKDEAIAQEIHKKLKDGLPQVNSTGVDEKNNVASVNAIVDERKF